MSAKHTDTDKVTFREFCCLVPNDRKADLVDGTMYLDPPDSCFANQIMGWSSSILTGYYSAKRAGGRVMLARFLFRLSKFNAVEPDVAYVRPERLHLVSRRWMRGGPDAAVEVVSRESRERDYGEKKRLYERAKVEEYWIIDPQQRRVEFHRLSGNRYELVPLEENRLFRSSVLPGFWLDVNWLLADPLPNVYECLQELLK